MSDPEAAPATDPQGEGAGVDEAVKNGSDKEPVSDKESVKNGAGKLDWGWYI
jgi:hypothetical protein